MRISVIIPVYNQEKFIGEALESVYTQTKKPDEVICINDASDDNTVELIKRNFPEVCILSNAQNMGPSYSRNRGIIHSNGELITFLDADDTWPRVKLEWQYDLMHNNPDIDIISGLGDYGVFGISDSRRQFLETQPHFNAYLAAFLIRRSVFDKVGLLDETLRLSEDQDWLLRARENGVRLKVVNKIALNIRVHPSNTTSGLDFKKSGMLHALRNSMRRREEGNSTINPIEYIFDPSK